MRSLKTRYLMNRRSSAAPTTVLGPMPRAWGARGHTCLERGGTAPSSAPNTTSAKSTRYLNRAVNRGGGPSIGRGARLEWGGAPR
eukprot:4708829-Alexandrium_andersonii.AAC.1